MSKAQIQNTNTQTHKYTNTAYDKVGVNLDFLKKSIIIYKWYLFGQYCFLTNKDAFDNVGGAQFAAF